MPLALRGPMFGLLGRAYPKLDWAPRIFRAKTTFQSLARTAVDAYFNSVSYLREPLRQSLYSKSFRAQLAGYSAREVFERHPRDPGTDQPLALIQNLDLKTYLVGDINTKVDRACMAHSLEVREPLMDHELVEWLATLPSDLKIRSGESKFLLKKSMEGRLPHDVLYRPKMGFAVPLASWFRGPLRNRVRSVLEGGNLAASELFNPRVLERLADQHFAGTADHSTPIWALLMFEAFVRRTESGHASPPAFNKAA
jgi:asparagine synthase (glutamine-hydrolysing)